MDAAARREQLLALYNDLKGRRDPALADCSPNLVFGAGYADADLMFVGEAPGAEEDRQRLPFVGRAGKLLDQLLAEVGLVRDEVFITNVLMQRPPGNRDPLPDEIEASKPHLYRKVELIEPKVVCTLGNFATKLLTRSSRGIRACGKAAGARARRPLGAGVPSLPPGGGTPHPGHPRGAARRLPRVAGAAGGAGAAAAGRHPSRARAGAGAADGPVRLVAYDNRFVPAAMRVAPGTTR